MICENCEENEATAKFRSIKVCGACELSLAAEENFFRKGTNFQPEDEFHEEEY